MKIYIDSAKPEELIEQKIKSMSHELKFSAEAVKPMSWHDNLEEPEDVRFLNLVHHAAQRPRKRYPETQTESQEIGWEAEPLVSPKRQDHRLNHFRVYKDITLYKAKLWLLGEKDHRK
uniref:Family with sequence similarity 183 member A n=2 Tax=Marmota marmota marmota TaxID=9994 RepID=A0A8C5ZP01_MARMA